MTTGERMRLRRKELGIKPDDIAKALEISRQAYYRYESGDRKRMEMSRMMLLADILKVSPYWLLGLDKMTKPGDIWRTTIYAWQAGDEGAYRI